MAHPPRNRILEALPPKDRHELVAAGVDVALRTGQRVLGARNRVARIYFPMSTCFSVQASPAEGAPEVMMIGFEGAMGAQLVLGPNAQPLAGTVECEGHALCVEASDLERQLGRSEQLRAVLLSYADVMIQQIAISCGCFHAHDVGQRLARRLLMSHDRAHREDFHVTHEVLAATLGVRRVGITNAATQMQRDGLIRYQRGDVAVLDRKRLESVACGCYAASRRCHVLAMRAPRV